MERERNECPERRWPGLVVAVHPSPRRFPACRRSTHAPGERGPYARIAVLRPHDGDTVEFEAGYIRHLEWHRQARDTWVWYGWKSRTVNGSGGSSTPSFGHSAASLDSPVTPADDERDNILNVTPHAQFVGNALYEYLPALSRGTGEPQPTPRLELTTVDLNAGAADAFEAALGARQSHCKEKRSGIGWSRVGPLRVTCGCVHGPAWRRFSKDGTSGRSRTRSNR